MPPVPPVVPEYPFQDICSDYFVSHGITYVTVVDRFSNWFNIYTGKGRAPFLVSSTRKPFQDFGIPEPITSAGGLQFICDRFQAFLKMYGVHHRLTSVAFLMLTPGQNRL